MSVKIRVKGSKETNEYKDALVLKEIFETAFRNKQINGEILIISNATLFGQSVKDVDLIAMGKFEKFPLKLKTKASALSINPSNNPKIKNGNRREKEVLDQVMRNVFIDDFCFVIETKTHPVELIELDGIFLKVRYGKNKWSDVTTQSENQKY